jgi:hypothetical protein
LANPDHIGILRGGVDAWNAWRSRSKVIPNLANAKLPAMDLSEAILSRADLRGAVLTSANLSAANLLQANLTRADLSLSNLGDANLSGADLFGANLEGAILADANFFAANLGSAILRDAIVFGTNLSQTDLELTDVTNATFDLAIFGNSDLSSLRGLETVKHAGPSVIGIDTIYRSSGNISEIFLRGAGVPEDFITFMRSLRGKTFEFYSCFISYSSRDESFARELHTRLQAQKVHCWFAPEDLKIGDKFQESIEESIWVYDKLLVILSENSVNSSWVEREVQAAFEKESRQGSAVLFPVRLDDAVMQSTRAWAADIRRTRHIGDFRNWKDQASFQSSLERLVRDLKAQKLPPAKQGSKQEQSASSLEERILEALANGSWGVGPMTGAGDRALRVTEIAQALSLNEEVVADTLERLHAWGRVLQHDGTLENPAPYWSFRRR